MDVVNVEDVVELFGEKKARWYQVQSRTQVIEAIRNQPDARILLKQPTGCGKTLTSGLILLSPEMRSTLVPNSNRPMRVLFVSHMHRLLAQAERAFAVEESIRVIDAETIESSSSVTEQFTPCNAEILYCTMNANFDYRFNPDLIIIDEGHHEGCTTIQLRIHNEYGNRPQILMTATDVRLDKLQLKYDVIVEPLTREEAVEHGYIMNSGLNTFIDTVGRNKSQLVVEIIENFHAQMDMSLVFLRTKNEVMMVADELDRIGLTYAALLDQTPEEVDTILNEFSEGKYKFILNCKRLGEGVDVSGVSDVIIGRTLTSYTQLNQIIGRSVRLGSESRVWEIVDPLSGTNLDSTKILGEPEYHNLWSKEKGEWVQRAMSVDY